MKGVKYFLLRPELKNIATFKALDSNLIKRLLLST